MATKPPFARQVALVCFLAPFIAIALNFAMFGTMRDNPIGSLIIGIISGLMILSSPLFGLIALLGIRKHGTKGILWRSLIGISVSALCIAVGIFVFMRASRGKMPTLQDLDLQTKVIGVWEDHTPGRTADIASWLLLAPDKTFQYRTTGSSIAQFSGTWSIQSRRMYLHVTKFVEGKNAAVGTKIIWSIYEISPNQLVFESGPQKVIYSKLFAAGEKSLDDLEHEFQLKDIGMSVYPTWLGAAEVSGGRVILSSYDDRSSFAASLRSSFTIPSSFMAVIVDNRSGSESIVIDPSSAKLISRNSSPLAAIPLEKLMASARKKDKSLSQFTGNITATPGQLSKGRMLFFPHGFNLSDITHVNISVNGNEISIPGKLMSAEDMLQADKRLRQQQNNP